MITLVSAYTPLVLSTSQVVQNWQENHKRLTEAFLAHLILPLQSFERVLCHGLIAYYEYVQSSIQTVSRQGDASRRAADILIRYHEPAPLPKLERPLRDCLVWMSFAIAGALRHSPDTVLEIDRILDKMQKRYIETQNWPWVQETLRRFFWDEVFLRDAKLLWDRAVRRTGVNPNLSSRPSTKFHLLPAA